MQQGCFDRTSSIKKEKVISFILTEFCVDVVLKTGLLLQVTGKAVMLDEIINYVQSLQRHVEVQD